MLPFASVGGIGFSSKRCHSNGNCALWQTEADGPNAISTLSVTLCIGLAPTLARITEKIGMNGNQRTGIRFYVYVSCLPDRSLVIRAQSSTVPRRAHTWISSFERSGN